MIEKIKHKKVLKGIILLILMFTILSMLFLSFRVLDYSFLDMEVEKSIGYAENSQSANTVTPTVNFIRESRSIVTYIPGIIILFVLLYFTFRMFNIVKIKVKEKKEKSNEEK